MQKLFIGTAFAIALSAAMITGAMAFGLGGSGVHSGVGGGHFGGFAARSGFGDGLGDAHLGGMRGGFGGYRGFPGYFGYGGYGRGLGGRGLGDYRD